MERDNPSSFNENERRHDIIHFVNHDKKEDVKKDTVKKYSGKIEATKYVAPIMISFILYSLCAWSTKVGFTEIIDLELPFIIVLTLILTELTIQGYAKIIYPIYLIVACLIYVFIGETYSLFFIISLTGTLVSYCLERIYYNENDYPCLAIDEFRIKSIFKRLKYHILLVFILFVVFLLLGYFYPGVFQQIVMPSVENLHKGVQDGTLELETVSLFINNFSVASNMILGGFYFSVSTVYMIIFNALYIGFSGAITNIRYFLAFTLPHGIIELSAIILAGACGLRITHSFLVLFNGIKFNEENRKEIFANACTTFIQMFMDAIILVVIVVLMLIIAAYIEANLTITIGTFLYNL